MKNKSRVYLRIQALACVLLALLFSATAVSICREGAARQALNPLESIYTPEIIAETVTHDTGALMTSPLFIDRDPILFRYILNILRDTHTHAAVGNTGVIACSPDQLSAEYEYYGIDRLT